MIPLRRRLGMLLCLVNGHRVTTAPVGWSERPCVTCGRLVFVHRQGPQ